MNCLICQQTIYFSSFQICDYCTKLLLKHSDTYCKKCGLKSESSDHCSYCISHKIHWDKLMFVSDYISPLKELIYIYKINRKKELSHSLARLLFLCWYKNRLTHYIAKPDAIIAVPLYRTTLLSRGFNQSAELARKLSHWLHCPFSINSITRTEKRQQQKNLSHKLREKNVSGLFNYSQSFVNQTVLIIDDIVTTGSTVNEIASNIRKLGAKNIYVLCLCRTLI